MYLLFLNEIVTKLLRQKLLEKNFGRDGDSLNPFLGLHVSGRMKRSYSFSVMKSTLPRLPIRKWQLDQYFDHWFNRQF
jgi:hypothetical protein